MTQVHRTPTGHWNPITRDISNVLLDISNVLSPGLAMSRRQVYVRPARRPLGAVVLKMEARSSCERSRQKP
jgi:hypothetical protein